jgi:hypothetical protein
MVANTSRYGRRFLGHQPNTLATDQFMILELGTPGVVPVHGRTINPRVFN